MMLNTVCLGLNFLMLFWVGKILQNHCNPDDPDPSKEKPVSDEKLVTKAVGNLSYITPARKRKFDIIQKIILFIANSRRSYLKVKGRGYGRIRR